MVKTRGPNHKNFLKFVKDLCQDIAQRHLSAFKPVSVCQRPMCYIFLNEIGYLNHSQW